jgi:hypothetical protein
MSCTDATRRLLGYAIGLGATALVLSPLLSGAADSFPVSTYPMFARPRGQPILYALVVTARDGTEGRVPAALVASGEVLQAKVLIQRSVEHGPAAMQALCEATAAKLAASAEGDTPSFVDVVRRRYDPISYFTRGPTPIDQERLFRCTVPGGLAP